MSNIKVYFLGSGLIAIPVLEALSKSSQIDLIGVGTQPDKLAGRKKKEKPTPVGVWAAANGIEVEKLKSVNDDEFLDELERKAPDFIFVASFGQILRKRVLELAKISCVNLHASILPAYRGASPIAESILQGDKKTGVSFMKMDVGLDTGPVYRIYDRSIGDEENALELEEGLGVLGAEHVEEVLLKISTGELLCQDQNDDLSTYAGKISKHDGIVNWSEKAAELAAKTRAYFPWPGLTFKVSNSSRETSLRITKATCVSDLSGKPGEVLRADKREWIIACGEGALALMEVVPAGKKEMSGSAFLNGFPIEAGAILES